VRRRDARGAGIPCDAGTADVEALAACIADRQLASAGRAVAAEFTGAYALLAEVALDDVLPGVCGP